MTQLEWENVASLASLGAGVIAAGLFLLPIFPGKLIETCERFVKALADFPRLCGACLFLASLLLCACLTLQRGFPQPLLHDESSYLLAADTFAHGRITNPTPRFWEHFETPQQLMRPTYMSKYPPGQGIALALGQLLTGKPIAGAWLSTAVATAAIYWMFLGFVSSPWALAGGIIAVFHPKLLDWSQSFWGGSVAVLGGALLLGGWVRLLNRLDKASAIVLAAGLIILANSRPFEGLVLSVPLMIALVCNRRKQLGNLVLPMGLPLLLGAIGMAYYNFRITGHALQIPYLEYARQYEIYPKFWFFSPRTDSIVFRNSTQEAVHRYFEKSAWLGFHTLAGARENSEYRIELLFNTGLNLAALLLPFMVGLLRSERPWSVGLKFAIGLFVVALWSEIFVFPHYIAPLVPGVLLIVIVGLRVIATWNWRGLAIGRAIIWAVMIGTLTGSGLADSQPMFKDRDLIAQQSITEQFPVLQSGRHFIFVQYGPMHSYHSELVHNLSNIDRQPIIWARRMEDSSDQEVAAEYADRNVWLLYVGGKTTLTPLKP